MPSIELLAQLKRRPALHPPNTEAALISRHAPQFKQYTYSDAETGLSIAYNLFLPTGYDSSQSYLMIVLIGNFTCAGMFAADKVSYSSQRWDRT